MEPLQAGEAVAGGALLFFVPGFTVAKAVFPERRVRGPDGVRWAVELAALALVLSVVLTVVLGYLLLVGSPGGFSATWSDPLLETALAGIALAAFVVGWLEGAYARVPRVAKVRVGDRDSFDAWALSEALDRLQRERLSLERDLRRRPAPEAEAAARLHARLEEVRGEEQTLRLRREAEYEV